MKKSKFGYDVPFKMFPTTMPHVSEYEELAEEHVKKLIEESGFKNVIKKSMFPIIDKKSAFYKNRKSQRKREAKICQDCPFRKGIEEQEANNGKTKND